MRTYQPMLHDTLCTAIYANTLIMDCCLGPSTAQMECWVQGKFLELVPWNSQVSWEVSPWGSWHISAKGKSHEAVVHATAEEDSGTALRAPTIDNGLTPFCRDSFYGKVSCCWTG